MSRRSKTVDAAIRHLWAEMARVAAAKAIKKIEWDRLDEAETFAGFTEKCLDKAGATATSWYFRI